MYKLPVSDINESTTRTAKGQYLNAILEADGEVKIVAIIEIDRKDKNIGSILIFSSTGGVKRIKTEDLMTNRKSVIAIKLKDGEDVVNAIYDSGNYADVLEDDMRE